MGTGTDNPATTALGKAEILFGQVHTHSLSLSLALSLSLSLSSTTALGKAEILFGQVHTHTHTHTHTYNNGDMTIDLQEFTPYTLLPTPYSLKPYSLLPKTLHPTPYTRWTTTGTRPST